MTSWTSAKAKNIKQLNRFFNCLRSFSNVFTDFRFDHPELSKMTSSMRNFSSESRAESVHVRKCASVVFNIQLSRNSQESGLLEEILSVVDFSSLILGQVLLCDSFMRLGEQSSHLEHFTSTFTVGSSKQRSVDVLESIGLEVDMSCISEVVSDTSNASDQV